MPENVYECYIPLLHSIHENNDVIKNQEKAFEIVIKFDYFNTSTLRVLIALFKQLIDIKGIGGVNVDWHYDKNDSDMLETAKMISNILSLPFNFIERE